MLGFTSQLPHRCCLAWPQHERSRVPGRPHGDFYFLLNGERFARVGKDPGFGPETLLCACAGLRVLPVSSLWFMNSAICVCSGHACVCVQTHSRMDSAARQLPGLPLKVLLHSALVSDSRAGRVRVMPSRGGGCRPNVQFCPCLAWHTNRVLTALKPSRAQGLGDTRWQPARCRCESGFASLLT